MINVLIPMGGHGKRFRDAGYTITKPLIDVNGMPMIKRVIDNLNIKGRYIFLVSEQDNKDFNLTSLLTQFCGENPCIVILESPGNRRGAASACLLAEEYINNDDQLMIANSDQIVEWDSNHFLEHMRSQKADGGILTFTAHEPKWSFAKVIPGTDIVTEVAEKNPISDKATAGIYWYKCGRDFVNGAKQMIAKDIRVNNEFYVCPVFNEIIEQGKLIHDYPITKMQGIGTPEDLKAYLEKCY